MGLFSFPTSEFFQPCLCLRFDHDRQNLDGRAGNIIEHTNLGHTEPILRSIESAESLDAAAPWLRGFMSQMRFEGCAYGTLNVCLQRLKVFDGLWSQDDVKTHSG